MEKGNSRRSKVAEDAAEVQLIASFEQKLKEKEIKKQEKLVAEKKREQERERKRREFESFQQEIDAMLNDDEVEEVKDTKSYVQLPISSVKGRWNDGEKQRQKAEEDRIKSERKARQAKDDKDRKKIAKEMLEKELEDIENSTGQGRRKRVKSESKPKKLNITIEDLEKQREDERQQKLAEERQRRIDEDRERMESERAKMSQSDDEVELKHEPKKEVNNIRKLNISAKDLEQQRIERERERTDAERRKREERDALLVETERAKYIDDTNDDDIEHIKKPTVTVGKISVNFDEIVAMKSEKDQKALASGMKDKMSHFRQLRQQSDKYKQEDQRLREAEFVAPKSEQIEQTSPNKLDHEQMNFDTAFREREEKQSKMIADDKMQQLKLEIRLMNEAKAQQMEDEMNNLVLESKNGASQQEVNRLGTEFTKFDKISEEKVAKEAVELREQKMQKLREEMEQFEHQRAEMEEEFDVSTIEKETSTIQIGRLDKVKASFDSVERQKEEDRVRQLKLNRMEELRSEIQKMEEDRQHWSDEREENAVRSQKIIPSKINYDFEQVQQERQKEEEQKLKQLKMDQMEEELEELQSAWQDEDEDDDEVAHQSDRIVMDPGRLSKQQLSFDKVAAAMDSADKLRIKYGRDKALKQETGTFRDLNKIQQNLTLQTNSQEHLYNKKVTDNKPKQQIKKMNTNTMFERMQREKDAEAERRLEEQRLARSQKEREEMIEAKQRELKEELNDLNSDETSYSDDEEMDGSPAFLEPLANKAFKEGQKFQLSCSIAGFPQPKVIWYHNKIPLPNGADYQYKVRGTNYYLCMAEVFREDEGIYTVRAINDKGVDMSDCQVTIS